MTDLAVAAAGAPWEAAALAEIDHARGLRLIRRCVDIADLLVLARTGGIQVALVDADLPGLDADAVHQMETAGVRVAAVTDLDGRAAATGVRIVVELGQIASIEQVVPAVAQRASSSGRLVAVWGPSGAPGRSTLALSLGAAAAARGRPTALIDADTCGGSLGQMLAVLDDVSGLMAACRAANQGRAAEVDQHVLMVQENLHLLTGIPRADMWPNVRVGALEIVLDRVREGYELVVADCSSALEIGDSGLGRSPNQAARHLLETADDVVLVGRADSVGLARLVRAVADLAEQVGRLDPLIVVNGLRPSLGWGAGEIAAMLARLAGREPDVFLPWDQQTLDEASLRGVTARAAAPASALVAAIDGLASLLFERSAVIPSPRPD